MSGLRSRKDDEGWSRWSCLPSKEPHDLSLVGEGSTLTRVTSYLVLPGRPVQPFVSSVKGLKTLRRIWIGTRTVVDRPGRLSEVRRDRKVWEENQRVYSLNPPFPKVEVSSPTLVNCFLSREVRDNGRTGPLSTSIFYCLYPFILLSLLCPLSRLWLCVSGPESSGVVRSPTKTFSSYYHLFFR